MALETPDSIPGDAGFGIEAGQSQKLPWPLLQQEGEGMLHLQQRS